MQRPLERAWELQQQWSASATAAHARIKRLRLANLVLLVAAAGVGAAGGVWNDHAPFVRACGIASAVLLGAAGLIQQRFIGSGEITRWVETRLAAERLKSSVWRTLGLGLDDALSDDSLLDDIDAAEQHVASLGAPVDPPAGERRALPAVSGFADYKQQRADDQATWHQNQVSGLMHRSQVLRGVELAITVLGIAVGALAAAYTGPTLTPIIAGLSAAAAAITAHLSASKYERIAAGYGSTARRLATLTTTLQLTPTTDEAARFVDQVERVLADQNTAWVSLLSAD